MPQTFRVFHMLQIAHSALFRAADKRMRRDHGLTTTQLGVLQILRQQDGRAISEIAQILAMGKSSLTGLIDRLSALGMITRAPSATDRRTTLIHLTQTGRDTAEQTLATTAQVNEAVLAPFSDDERAVIQRFLSHLAVQADRIINPDDERPDD
jgi:DNA-binding MarR family transcriptional regulator